MMLKKQLQKGHIPDDSMLAKFKDQIDLALCSTKETSMSQSYLIHKQFLYFKGEVTPALSKLCLKVFTIFLKTNEGY